MLLRIKSLSAELSDYRILPILCWIIFPALIVRGHFTPVLSEAAFLYSSPVCGDTRAWWKAVFICGISLWMLFHLLLCIFAGWRPRCLRFGLLLGLAALSVFISTFFSKYPQTSWLGYTNLYEGAAVLLSYLFAAWYTAEMAYEEKTRLLLVRTIGVVGLINGCHGIAEGFGWHFWQSDLGLWLMGASHGSVAYVFSDSRMAYGTVFQPNHYGMLMAMLSSLALGMYFYETLIKGKIFWLLVLVTGVSGIIFSQSRAGIFTFIGVLIAFAIRNILQSYKGNPSFSRLRKYAIFILLPCCVIAAVIAGSTTMRGAITRLIQRSRSLSGSMPQTVQIKTVDLQDNRLYIHLPDQTLVLEKRSPDTWLVQQGRQSSRRTVLSFGHKDNKGWRTAEIPGASNSRLSYRDQGNIKVSGPDTELYFYSIGSKIWLVDTNNNQLYTTILLPPYSLTGFEGFLNGRGFIWTGALPFVRENLFFGSGPGTFALSFPNLDILSKYRFSQGMNPDKGHGIWVTFLVQLGIIGTLLYCAPVGYALWNRGGMLRIPLFMGAIAYCLCSLTNDSTVGVTPIFCALLGINVADSIA